jgi:hypothetical protein
MSGHKVEDRLRVDVGAAHCIGVKEEEDWGGGVNQDQASARLVSAA